MINVLKKLRERDGFSQEELADKLGVSRQTIYKYESGENKLSLDSVEKLSKIFDVDYACLIDNKMPVDPSYKVIESHKKTNIKTNTETELRINIPQEHIDKFKQVFLYVLKKVGAKPNVGRTVLYKLLYFIDFDYYELYEEQLMGLKYIKNNYGPTPIDFEKIIKNMENEGVLDIVKTKYFDHDQTKYLPIKEPNLSKLSAQEIKHIDLILDKLSDKTAKELSDFSHKDIPWISTKMRDVIEYDSVFYRNDDTSVRQYND